MKLYGIANCDTVKKARRWLEDAGLDYEFHNYKTDGVDEERLRVFVDDFGWDKVLNRRGTTWRKQPDEVKEAVNDPETALQLMLAEPSMIKRPILETSGRNMIGFDQTNWEMALETGELSKDS